MDPISPVKDKDLECLILWPKGSMGWDNDLKILHALNHLCRRRGYGAIQQLATWLEELQKDPAKKAEFTERRKQHLATMRDHWGLSVIPEED